MASSSALWKALINKGIMIGIIFFIRLTIFLLSKSAPRAICAFIIFSVSSIKVGIKRRAIVIIIAISCAGIGILIILNIDNNLSIPSVSAIGEVVNVNQEVDIINKNNLVAINKPR